MKQIGDIVPFPNGAQASAFFGALATALLPSLGFTEETPYYCPQKSSICIKCGNGCQDETNLRKHHGTLYHDFSTITGVNFGWAWPEDESECHTIPGAGSTWRWPDEFIGFIMDYAGLDWRRIKRSAPKEEILQAIIASIDRGFPALIKLGDGPDWHVITGYDGDVLYGLDSHNHFDASVHPVVQPDWYTDDGLCVLSQWYEPFEDAIILTGRRAPSVTLKEILQKIIPILEHPAHTRLEADLSRRIDEINPDNAQETAIWLNNVAGFPIEARWHAAESFISGESTTYGLNRLTGDEAMKKLFWQLFVRYIANDSDETHGVLWKVWAQLGVGPETGYAVPANAGELILQPEARVELRRLFGLVFKNDRNVLDALSEALGLL